MSLYRHLLRRSPASSLSFLNPRIHFCNYSASSGTTNHIDHKRNHEFLPPNEFLNSWKSPKDPKEAQAQLARLRREYALKVKAVRKEYIREMEFQKLEKLKKDLARKEALRIANEERKAAKEAERKVKAKEREAAEEEFRQTLVCCQITVLCCCGLSVWLVVYVDIQEWVFRKDNGRENQFMFSHVYKFIA